MITCTALCINDSAVAVEFYAFHGADGFQDVGKLADTGRLNNNVIRLVGIDDLLQSGFEVAFQRAADASAVDLCDLYAGFLQETAVNADLTKFIFDQNDLAPGIDFFDQLLDQCCFSGAEETGYDIYFTHGNTFFRNR